MIAATSIEFYKNLAQYDYNNRYYDLHNDYDCENLSYSNGTLLFPFRSLADGALLLLKFTDVKIVSIDFFNVKEEENLTLDNLYRGRAELDGDLIDVSEDGEGYFYLEFNEGQKMEFWAKGMSAE